MPRFLERHAGWLVLAAWLLLPFTIVLGLAISVGSGINAFYHPQHRGAPFDRFAIQVAYVAQAANLVAAVASSVLLALRRRFAAAAVVVGCFGVLLVGTTGAGLLVRAGPEHFIRYVGTERFSVPWQYNPRGEERPNNFGFRVTLCASNLRGTY